MKFQKQESVLHVCGAKAAMILATVMPIILAASYPPGGGMPDTVIIKTGNVYTGEVLEVTDTHVQFLEQGASVPQGLLKRTLSKVVREDGEVLFEAAPEPDVSISLPEEQRDFYNDGLNKCLQQDNQYVGTMVAGAGTGFLFGLIGWGVGFAMLSGSEVEVPGHYLLNMSPVEKSQYSEGYRKCAKKARNRAWHRGAIPGALLAGIVVSSMRE